jgi:hypothetical protein
MQNNSSLGKTMANLAARGIGYEIVKDPVLDKDGNQLKDSSGNPVFSNRIIIKSVPPEEAELNRFYTLQIPCWFDGCEELRKEYKEALDKAGKGPDGTCTDCEKGAIMRMFADRVKLAIKNSKSVK